MLKPALAEAALKWLLLAAASLRLVHKDLKKKMNNFSFQAPIVCIQLGLSSSPHNGRALQIFEFLNVF